MSKDSIRALLVAIILLLSFLLARSTEAWEVVELGDVSLSYKDFFDGGRDPLITSNGLPGRRLGKQAALNLNVHILEYGYFNNLVHGTTDEDARGKGQFRAVGWQWETGIDAGMVQVYYAHHSQHLLDAVYAHDHFPVQDAIGFRVFLHRRKK